MTARSKLKVVVASTVYNFEDQLNQICAVLKGFGYEVWNSHLGSMPVDPNLSNLNNCLAAVREADLFLGIVRPFYGSGVIGDRSIFHEECREAVRLLKPRWFLVHRDVVFARQLLRPYMFRKNGDVTKFTLKKSAVMDDIRVVHLYNDVIQNDVPVPDRRGHWAQEFYRVSEALEYLDNQFKSVKRIRRICEEMRPV